MLTQTTKSAAWTLALVLISPLAIGARTESDVAARRSIQAAYKAGQAAFNRGDSRALLAQLAPGYYAIDLKGQKLSRSEVARSMRLWFSTSKTLRARVTIKSLRVSGSRATAVIEEHARASGVNPKTKKLTKLVSDSAVQEVWARAGGRWLKQSTKTLRMRWVVEGKVWKL